MNKLDAKIKLKTISTVIILSLLMFGCSRKVVDKKVVINGYVVEGTIINDSLLDGFVRFKSFDGQLVYTGNFFQGKKQGSFNYFNKEGIRTDSMNFFNDEMHGDQFTYDRGEKVQHIIQYFHGIKMGGETFFVNGKVDKFFFSDFHKSDLIACTFDSLGKLDTISFFTTNPSVKTVVAGGERKISIFSYLPDVPDAEVSYKLGLTNSKLGDSILFPLSKRNSFIDTFLEFPKPNNYYFISAHIKGGKKFNRIFIEELRHKE